MTRIALRRANFLAAMSLLSLALLAAPAFAQNIRKFEGLIKARNGDTLTLQTTDSRELAVVLTDETQVGQEQGLFKARRKEMSMAALIPGLKIKLEGTYETQDRVVAKSISFKGDDLEHAQQIDAGLHETKAQVQQNTADLEKQKEALQQHEQQITATASHQLSKPLFQPSSIE